jgi:putative FmdB family regulatory protein
MPTYQYECESCGHALEVFQSMTDKKLKKCPKCKKALAGMKLKPDGTLTVDVSEGPETEIRAFACPHCKEWVHWGIRTPPPAPSRLRRGEKGEG